MNHKYTKEKLELLVKSSSSVAEILRKLDLNQSGGNHSHLSSRIKKFKLDTSHFKGKSSNLGKVSSKKKSWNQVLVLKKHGVREKAWRLRRALLEANTGHVCDVCKTPPIWNQKSLQLEVDHKNKNFLDNRLENLRFLCPNCHSQTEGYNGSKNLTGLTDTNLYSRLRRARG